MRGRKRWRVREREKERGWRKKGGNWDSKREIDLDSGKYESETQRYTHIRDREGEMRGKERQREIERQRQSMKESINMLWYSSCLLTYMHVAEKHV